MMIQLPIVVQTKEPPGPECYSFGRVFAGAQLPARYPLCEDMEWCVVITEMSDLPEKITITTKAEAEALLSTYTVEQVRQLWENGAFASPLPPEAKEYFVQLLLNPPKTD